MEEGSKLNIPLIVGLAIPIILTIFVAISIRVPQVLAKPQYSFVYATGPYPTYEKVTPESITTYRYAVEGGRLTLAQETVSRDPGERYFSRFQQAEPEFYRYDVTSKTSEKISFEQASALHLDEKRNAPDGFRVTRGDYSTGLFEIFVGGNDRGYYLQKDSASHRIELEETSDSYYDFEFIGWVIK